MGANIVSFDRNLYITSEVYKLHSDILDNVLQLVY